MTSMPIGSLLLQVRLVLVRLNWINVAAGALFIASAAAWFCVLPYLHAETARQQRLVLLTQQALHVADKASVIPDRSHNEERLNAFQDMLGETRYEEQQIKALFAIAGKSGLSLERAEYKSAYDKIGRYYTYQILLPVKGSYSMIRRFCEQTLMTIPFASLDHLNFKRDEIGNNIVEAQLRFTLYLSDSSATLHGTAVSHEKVE